MSAAPKAEVAAAVINFNTAGLAVRSVESLLAAGVPRILVLDNASGEADYRRLCEALGSRPGVRLVRSESNLGFAAGSNRLIDEALADAACERVLLLNSDAIVEGRGLDACLDAMRRGGYDLMGGRMMKLAAPGAAAEVDSLGITLYGSLLASNRKSTADAYLGPTGGFALYSRRFLEEVKRMHSYVFDDAYFCYAEDTDLCVRARLLGFDAGYVDEVVAHHEGQASNAGQYNDFILYHGIRNSIWMAAKSIPGRILLARLPSVIALHGAIVLRHTLQGRIGTLWRLYRDAIARLPEVLRQRRAIQASRRVTPREFRAHIDRQFYEPVFLKGAVRDLFRRPPTG